MPISIKIVPPTPLDIYSQPFTASASTTPMALKPKPISLDPEIKSQIDFLKSKNTPIQDIHDAIDLHPDITDKELAKNYANSTQAITPPGPDIKESVPIAHAISKESVGKVIPKAEPSQQNASKDSIINESVQYPSLKNPLGSRTTEVIKSESTPAFSGVIDGIDFASSTKGSYAEDPKQHVTQLRRIIDTMPKEITMNTLTKHIKSLFPESPLNGKIIFEIAKTYKITPRVLAATLQNDSGYGTTGAGAKTHNPGNVSTYGDKVGKYNTWYDGVDAAAYELAKRKVVGNTK